MSVCVEKLPHPECGSSDGLQVFEKEDGTHDGFCFACSTHVADPYSDKPEGYHPAAKLKKTPEQIEQELAEIAECKAFDLPTRYLKEEYLAYFGVKVAVDTVNAEEPAVTFFPYTKDGAIVAYKARMLKDKRMWAVGPLKDVELFGWQQALSSGAKRLIVTEGEYDAVAVFQALKETNKNTPYAAFDPAVVSVPNGASGALKSLLRASDEIRKSFKEVVLAFDMDEPGQKAAQEVSKKMGGVMVAKLPEKDPNECIARGRTKGLRSAVMFKANVQKNTKIIYGSALREQAMKAPEMGLSWPWRGLTDVTRGIRRGETIYVGAGVKMGKSEVVNTWGKHLIVDHDLPVFFVKPEEAPGKTYQMLVGKVAGCIFHDPSIPFDHEAFEKAEKLIGDKAIIQDIYQFVDWDTLKDDIRYVVNVDGVKDVMLDPITCFTNTVSSGEANDVLVQIASELSSMAKDLDFTAYIFCHLKAPPLGSTPHELGGKVMSNQFAGSRAMMRSCNYMMALEGNKDPDLPIHQKNIRNLVVLEDREFGMSARIPLYWDNHTGLFNEIQTP